MTSSDVFVRKATGIVRAFSAIDLFNIGVLAAWFPAGVMFLTSWTELLYPGADGGLIMWFGLLCAFFPTLIYALFTIIMPRSGGEYVFVSRGLTPYIGFAANLLAVSTIWLCMGIDQTLFVDWGYNVLLGSLGYLTKNPGMLALASSLSSPNGYLILGTIDLAVICIIATFSSRTISRILLGLATLMYISVFLWIIIFAITPQSAFIARFNEVLGGYATYDSVLATAKEAGYARTPFSLYVSFSAMGYGIWMFYGWLFPSYVGGEARKVKTSMPLALLGGLVFLTVFESIGIWLAQNSMGIEFGYALAYLRSAAPEQFPYPAYPWSATLVGIMTSSLPLMFLIVIGTTTGFWGNDISKVLSASRCLFAWSFDRVVPAKVAYVSERFHAPTVATIITFIAGWLSLLLAIYTPILAYLVNLAGFALISMSVTCIAAIVLPFTNPGIFDLAPDWVKKRIGGISVMSIVGVIGAGFSIYAAWYALTVPIMGPTHPAAYSLITGIFIVGIIIYFAARYYHLKKEGIDINMAFKVLAPE